MSLRGIGKALAYCVAGLVVLVLALMLGIKLALDRAPKYQEQIKAWVHRQTGYQIAFAGVSPAFRWYGPELSFERLELKTDDGRRELARAALGRIGLDIWRMLQSGRVFALRVELDSPTIVITRLGPTTFALAREVILGGEEEGAFAKLTLKDLPAGTLVIRRGFVTLNDWNAELARLDLSAVNLDLSRVSELAALQFSARLPSVLGDQLSFNGTARGSAPLTKLEWSALASASGVSFPGWRKLLPEYLTRLDAGSGEFEVRVQGRGATLVHADLDFGAQGVVTQPTDNANTKMEVSASLTLTHAGDRWTLLGRRVHTSRAGRRDPNSQFDVTWRGDESGVLALEARANYLRAEALLPLVGLLPQRDLRERLRELSPSGEWMEMQLSLERSKVTDPWAFETRARFRDVGFAPLGHAPGLRGLSGVLSGSDHAGHLIIDSRAAVFNWPNQFPQPIDLPTLQVTLYWRRTAEELLVATSNLALSTRDASVRGKAAWRQPSDGSSPVLTLASTIDNGNAADARLYFPHELIAPAALAWLDRAFVAGYVSHGDLVYAGPVRHFPFRDGSGLFLVRFRVDHLTLDYAQGWPRIENLAAQAEFRNEGMSVKVMSASAADLKVDSGDARFVDFKSGELLIHAAAHGDAADALHYLASTPLDAMADRGFSGVEARGALKTSVQLFFPFKQFDQRRVTVHVDLDEATLNRPGSTLAATDLSGTADIDGAQVAHADIHGHVLGGAFQMTARVPRNRPLVRTQLDFRGTLSGEALRAVLPLPANAGVRGQTDWHAVLRMAPEPSRERSLRITSNLAGLELKLPAPLDKPAGTTMPASVDMLWPASGGTQLRVGLGSVLHAALTLDSDANGSKLARAALAFGEGEPVFSESQAVNVGGRIEKLDLAGWLSVGTAAAKGAKPLASYLRAANLSVGRIDYRGLAFLDVDLALTATDSGWRIDTSGPNVVGSIVIPQDSSAAWNLEFERLKLVDAKEAGATDDQGGTGGADLSGGADSMSGADPRTLPAARVHAAQLAWGDREFGEVRAELVRLEDGVSLKQLTAASPTFTANATGEWRGAGGHLEGGMVSTDVGESLKQLGFAAVLEAKSGHVEFDLSWTGAPTTRALAEARGHVHVALEKGQIVNLKPGAGRVLGLASFAELPRRLALDFSDLTDKGFAFDTVRGDFDLQDGNAHTDNVLVKGPAAEIGLIGRVGLKNHDYDQTAVVTGNVSTTPLSLAGFAAGPVVGGAVLLFTQVFKQPLKGLVRGYYRITGSWDNPTVERIKSADAAGATAEAPK